MTTEEIRAIPGVQAVLEGTEPGKDIVIVAGIHGNETCGIRAFEQVLPSLSIECGRVTFVLGNLKAIESGMRFVEQNLNRLFKADELLTDAQKSSYEYARSRELLPLLVIADAVLDIHSSGTVGSTPFAICDRSRISDTDFLPFSIVSYGWDALEPGGTDDFVTSQGGVGFCIECGYHEDPEAVGRAVDSIYAFLGIFGAASEVPTVQLPASRRHIEVTRIHKTRENFVSLRHFADFEAVTKGMVIGTDGTEDIAVPSDGVVIFVRERMNPGEEAFIFGRVQESA